MQAFRLDDLLRQHLAGGEHWSEFLRVPALSMGLYTLPAGSVDPQEPHDEDEVYYVISGRATIRVGDEDRPVQPGVLVFVAAGVEHRFHSIQEDLAVLVFFAPAEGTGTRTIDGD
jgi:mannose-6-phosphate isomerase-like protein (cupin superfamily)